MSTNYTVALGEKNEEMLETLAKQKGVTKAEVIRRAIASYFFLAQEEAQGRKIAVTGDGDRVLKELVLP